MAEWVAHRGWKTRYPENTLASVTAALDAGGRWVEVDVQLARDGVPVLLHDAALGRTTGQPGDVFDYSADELQALQGCDIPRLSEVLNTLRQYPQAILFVEVKDESVECFGLDETVACVMNLVGADAAQCVLIAFNEQVLIHARQYAPIAVGWILDRFDAEAHCTAESLQPEFLICHYRKLAGQPPWPGAWQWMLYEINDCRTAAAFAGQGVGYIETADIGGMLEACPDPGRLT